MKNAIKLTLAAALLAIPTNAYAMPEQVPDRYYDQMWNWVYSDVLSVHRPCVGPAAFMCNLWI
jgi:hypothetical protein